MKLIYKSSYDRGLIYLLKMWSDIKKEIPDATLDIYYGWVLFDKFHSNNPDMLKWKNEMLELMKQDGITEHGRVSKEELDKATANADIWAYPTDFGETNCISALDSLKLGCVPVTVNYAGLQDTVYAGVKIDVDTNKPSFMSLPENQKKWLDALFKLWKDKKRYEAEKIKGIEGAKDFEWEIIARKWMDHF
jgi:glycosyltransferase involved in cell wall biosynthesis